MNKYAQNWSLCLNNMKISKEIVKVNIDRRKINNWEGNLYLIVGFVHRPHIERLK